MISKFCFDFQMRRFKKVERRNDERVQKMARESVKGRARQNWANWTCNVQTQRESNYAEL
jgi:hypothetical protein